MKQGSGISSHSAGKTEPRSTAVSPEAAAQIGIQTMNTQSVPLTTGRGFTAPSPVAETHHQAGSQGKHK